MKKREHKKYHKQHRLLQRMVKGLDVLLVTSPFAICWFLVYLQGMQEPLYKWGNWVIVLLFLAIYYFLAHLYSGFLLHLSRISELIYSQMLALVLDDILMYIVICLVSNDIVSVIPILVTFLIQALIIVLWCYCAHQWYFNHFAKKKTVIVWDQREGLEQLIRQYDMDKHFEIVAAVSVQDCIENEYAILKNAEVVFYSGVHSYDRNAILKHCIDHNIVSYVIPRIGDVILSGAINTHLLHLPIQMVERYNPKPEYIILKRLFDVIMSLLVLVVLFPLFAVVAIAIKCTDGGPALYRQTRLTKDGKEFDVLKFRSMRVDAEKDGKARLSSGEDDPRITHVGRVIRKFRIDEFPQLINIIKGDMSIVGPRPERPEISDQYEKEIPEFRLRLQTKAGLTGYAQVYGKYNTSPYDKLLMDLMYIARPSLVEDFKIIFATIKILFLPESTEGVAAGQTTAMDYENEENLTEKWEKREEHWAD